MVHLFAGCFLFFAHGALALEHWQVVVLYNSEIPESGELARIYAEARAIPESRIIGLPMPKEADISRDQYEQMIREPLVRYFDKKEWWQRRREADGGLLVPVENRIRAIAIMHGTPLRIKPTASAADSDEGRERHPVNDRDEASVDSELALFGIDRIPAHGAGQNPYFGRDVRFGDAQLPFMVLTARIDASSLAICKRMIADVMRTEATGLWGMAYVDIANKFPLGDGWLEEIINRNRGLGIPTVVDRFDETLPIHYPMHDAALYFGWYDHHVSGPLVNPRFRFRRGAVAVHIHSFSAAQLHNAGRNWCAPILGAGAAATLGNVHEPYLHMSHHLQTFHDRLLKGYTLVESAWMAMPCHSWQGVVLGDPLYRPFMHFPERGEIAGTDRDFRALAVAKKSWPDDPVAMREQLAAAAERMRSGYIAESLALDAMADDDGERVEYWLRKAADWHDVSGHQIRIILHKVAWLRHRGNLAEAVELLTHAYEKFEHDGEAKALDAWRKLLEPAGAEAIE